MLTRILRYLLSVLMLINGASVILAQKRPSAHPLPLTPSTTDYLYRSWKKLSIAQGRDLSLYDQEGSQCCWHLNSIVKARDFLWQHWREKRRAYLIIEFMGIDSVDNAHIFIEPDAGGEWHVVWRWERAFPPRRRISSVEDLPDIRSIERRPANEEKSRNKDEDQYVLVFIGQDGKELEKL